MGSSWPSSKSGVVDVNEPTSRSSSCLNSSSDISLILRRTITSTSICVCGSPSPRLRSSIPALRRFAVFARSELRKRPFPRIQAIALLLHLDLIGARLVGDLEQLLEQQIVHDQSLRS